MVLTYQTTVNAPGGGISHANAAEVVASSTSDPDSTPNDGTGDDFISGSTTPQQADVSVSKSALPTSGNPGDTVSWTIAVSNAGPDAATNVNVEDVLPNGDSYVPASIGVLLATTSAALAWLIPPPGAFTVV